MNLFNRSRKILTGLFAASVLVSGASASTIEGSLAFSFAVVGQSATNLANPTDVITALATSTNNVGVGDYSVVPVLTVYSGFSLDLSTIATGGGFAIGSLGYGTFTANFGQIVYQSCTGTNPFSCALDVYLKGTYSGLPEFADSASSFRLNFNQSNTSVSGSATLTSPPLPAPQIPEPATLFLFGGALVGIGMFRRKQRVR